MRKVLILLIFFVLLSSIAIASPTAKITVKAIDEQGAVVKNAKVSVGFVVPNKKGFGTTEIHKEGYTDNYGEFTTSSESMDLLGFSVDKDGFYQSGTGYKFMSESKLLNRWEPWNPIIEVVLKKKRNPIPMYVKDTGWINIPKLDIKIGYDFERGDWVAPYGIGLNSDLLLELNLTKQSYTNYDANLIVTFPNSYDGIQPYYFDLNDQSVFKWPFEAPVSGYKHSVNIFERDNPVNGYQANKQKNVNYIFRVRTEVDKEGNIIEAYYGKILGEFGISRKGKTKIMYYFNPDGTRNLEENPIGNLFDIE